MGSEQEETGENTPGEKYEDVGELEESEIKELVVSEHFQNPAGSREQRYVYLEEPRSANRCIQRAWGRAIWGLKVELKGSLCDGHGL